METRWIGKSASWDLVWLYFPGVLAVLLSHLIPFAEDSTLTIVFAFIALGLLDSGHVYTTVWRTYFHSPERKRSLVYLWAPLGFFLLFFWWSFLNIPFLGPFVVYITLYHNFKQLYGVNSWFQRLNLSAQKNDKKIFYFLTLAPIFIAHFRSDFPKIAYYSTNDFFWVPNAQIFRPLVLSYFCLAGSWLIFEWRAHRSWLRIFSLIYSAILYSVCFLVGKNLSQVLFPLVISHGMAYLGLMSTVLPKLQKENFRFKRPVLWIVGTAIVFGSLEFFLEDSFWNRSNPYFAISSALLLTPLFCHYFFDSFLWRRNHPEANRIYN